MYAVTDDYLTALKSTHRTTALLTATSPDKTTVVTLGIQSGSLTATYQQGTRRTADITIHATGTLPDGTSMQAGSVAALLKRPGTLLLLEMGVSGMSLANTTIPMMTGIATNVSWRVGDGEIDLSLTDEWWRVSQGRFTGAWTPTAGTARRTAVETLMQQVAPNRQTIDTATDTGTINTQGDWGSDRDTAINTLCTDGGFDAYFDRNGNIHLEDSKTADGMSVLTLTPGDNGTLETLETGLDAQRLYNTVVVKPSATDNSQTWAAQSASLTTGDRAPATLGVTIPYFIASPTIKVAADALAVAQRHLAFVTGTEETLECTAIGNPALDEGDVIQVLVPASQLEGTTATLWKYYVDSITWDVTTGDMSVKARNQGEVTENA